MWTITDDPVADNDSYQEWLEEMHTDYDVPLCEWCNKPLDHQGDDTCILTDAGEYICRDCSEKMWESKRKEWEHARMRCIPYMERI